MVIGEGITKIDFLEDFVYS